VFELPNAPGTFAQHYETIKRITAATKFEQPIAIEQ